MRSQLKLASISSCCMTMLCVMMCVIPVILVIMLAIGITFITNKTYSINTECSLPNGKITFVGDNIITVHFYRNNVKITSRAVFHDEIHENDTFPCHYNRNSMGLIKYGTKETYYGNTGTVMTYHVSIPLGIVWLFASVMHCACGSLFCYAVFKPNSRNKYEMA
jgi:hypothetical protein